MRIATFFTVILFATLTLSATDAVAKDEIYRWVDENGVVHFGDRPDEQANAEQIELKTDSGTSSSEPPISTHSGQQDQQPSYAQQQRDDRAKKRKEAAEEQEKIDAGCKFHSEQIAQLEPTPRVNVIYEDGTVVRMDDNERLEHLAKSKAFVAENCNK